MRLVYHTLVNNHVYKHLRNWTYRRYRIRRTIATSAFGRTRCSRLAYTWTTGHVGGTVERRLGSSGWYVSTSGMSWEVSRIVFPIVDAPAYGCGNRLNWPHHQLFTYPNKFLVAAGHRGSDKQGSTVFVYNRQFVCLIIMEWQNQKNTLTWKFYTVDWEIFIVKNFPAIAFNDKN